MKTNVNIIEVKILSRLVAIKYNNDTKTSSLSSTYTYRYIWYISDLGILL